MRPIKYALMPIAAFLLLASSASAQYTPEKGSAERKAIMDALRASVKNVKGLTGSIIFAVDRLQVKDSWAFVIATPQSADGQPLTAFQNSCDADPDVVGLLRKRGNRWRVVTRDVCNSDVSYGDWDKRYGAPRSILGLN